MHFIPDFCGFSVQIIEQFEKADEKTADKSEKTADKSEKSEKTTIASSKHGLNEFRDSKGSREALSTASSTHSLNLIRKGINLITGSKSDLHDKEKAKAAILKTKKSLNDFVFLAVLGKGNFGKVSLFNVS
jgi:hypothetical protein